MKPDGGPAFPYPRDEDEKRQAAAMGVPVSNYIHGMSLRDYFAGQIVRAVVPFDWNADTSTFPSYAEHFAKSAYALADAMLAERAK